MNFSIKSPPYNLKVVQIYALYSSQFTSTQAIPFIKFVKHRYISMDHMHHISPAGGYMNCLAGTKIIPG